MRSNEMRRRSHLRGRDAAPVTLRQTVVLAVLLLFFSPVFAADWYASPSGSDGNSCASAAAPCKTIQAAINKAAANDTVRVASGNYAFVAPGIEINKAGLTLVGDNTPFAVDPHGAPGTLNNIAANASVLQKAGSGSQTSQRMIWVNNVRDVTIRNLYLQTALAKTKEAVVAIGDIDGLLIENNYIKFTSNGSSAFGISINGAYSGSGSASSIPASFPRMAGGFVTIRDNVLEPTLGGVWSTYLPKRAILFEKSLGLIQGNQMVGLTVDLWTSGTSGTTATAVADRHLTIDGNWFFGGLQNQINPVSGTATALNITNNHYWTPGSSFSPIAISYNPASATSSESHLLRVASNQTVPTLIEGNDFAGFTNQYRALWLQSRRNVTVRGNTFTPEPNAGEFTAITIGNRVVQTQTPSDPVAFGALSIVGNSFLGSGAANKGKAVLFLNDNDKGGLAIGDTPFVATIGGAGVAEANDFDTNIRWYIAIDDRTCTALNHNSSGACNGTSSYAIGEGISYSGGADTASEKRPFVWDVSAPGNKFGGVSMAGMNQAQFDVVWAKTFERHLSTLAPSTLGEVDYGWTPVITVGTVVFSPTAFTYDGVAHTIGANLQEDSGATCVVTPATVTNAGDTPVSAVCTSPGYNVSGNGTVSVAKAAGTVQLDKTAFTYTGSAQTLSPSMPEDSGATCTATPSSVTDAGTYSITIGCTGDNYAASGSIDVTVAKATGTVQLDETSFTYTGSAQTFSPSMQEDSGATCTATPASVTDAGTHSIAISCTGANYTASGSIDVTVAKATGTVQLDETSFTYTGSAQTLSPSMQEDSGATCTATPASVTDAGTHSIAISCTGANYTASGSIDVTVAKAVGTVTFGPTSFTFDGTAHTTTAVITEESGNTTACDLTYDTQAPLHAGTSSVEASCDGNNYTANATESLTVDPAPLTLTLAGTGIFGYDGVDHPASVSVSGEVAGFPAATTILYNGVANLPNDVGNYAVVAALDAGVTDYSATDATGQIEIIAATASVLISDLLQTFDGQPKPVSTSTDPVGLDVTVTYEGDTTPPTAVGIYAVVATIADPNYSGSTNATLEIVAAAAPDLAISLDVDRNYATYGSTIIYTITVSNVGNRDVASASVSDLLPVELDATNANWSCIAGTGASCAASGNGDLSDTASIPMGNSVTYLLSAQVLDPSPASEVVVNTVSVSAAGDVDANNDQASSSVNIVLFRDGFENPEP